MATLPLTDAQAGHLLALNVAGRAIHYRKADGSYTLRGRNYPEPKPVAEADVDAMITHGYIGRQDQRAVWFITERGKLALEDYLTPGA